MKTGNVKWSDEVFKIFRLDPKGFTPQIDSNTGIIAVARRTTAWPGVDQIGRTESHRPRFLWTKSSFVRIKVCYYYFEFQGEYDDSGNLISIIGTVLDITQRKIAEEALKASEQNFPQSFGQFFHGYLYRRCGQTYPVREPGILISLAIKISKKASARPTAWTLHTSRIC